MLAHARFEPFCFLPATHAASNAVTSSTADWSGISRLRQAKVAPKVRAARSCLLTAWLQRPDRSSVTSPRLMGPRVKKPASCRQKQQQRRDFAALVFSWLVIPAEAGIQLFGFYEDLTLKTGSRPPPG